MPSRQISLSTAAVCLVLTSCAKTDWHPEPAELDVSKLTVKVFWSASDSEQGYSAIRTGAMAAEQTEIVKKAESYIQLDLQDDGDTPEEAARIAREISLNPDVLAVIGHSRSGTTRAAIPFYAEAGIPILMPTATSPYVLYQFDERAPWPSVDLMRKETAYHRFTNAFRLRPSDVPDQVNAMKLTLTTLTNMRRPKVMLICDTTSRNGSDVYTKPMCDYLLADTDFGPKIASYRPFGLDSDIYGLVTEIHAVNPDYIFILGYPELARDVLQELKERAPAGQQKLPYKFVMPDASLQNYLIRFSNDIYVTSSFNAGRAKSCDSALAKTLSDYLLAKKPQGVATTDESYTFDAVLILANAVNSCKSQRVDRACIMQYLETNHEELPGACETYHIDRGERRNAAFNVNAACRGTFEVKWFATRNKTTLDENSDWCKQSNR